MNKYGKMAAALVLGATAAAAAAGVADAQPYDGHRGRCGNYMAMDAPSPELQKMMEEAYVRMAPLLLEMRAKRDELTAKIYSGADQAVIDGLKKELNALQVKINDEHVNIEQQLAKAGVPLHAAGRCLFGAGGFSGHRGMGHRGMGPGFHDMGPCPQTGRGYGMHGHGPAMPPPAPGK